MRDGHNLYVRLVYTRKLTLAKLFRAVFIDIVIINPVMINLVIRARRRQLITPKDTLNNSPLTYDTVR